MKYIIIFIALFGITHAATTPADLDITKRVHERIGRGILTKGFERVNVQVSEQVVTLTGTVNTKADKEKVEKELANVAGVKSVNNRLVIQESYYEPEPNEEPGPDKYLTYEDNKLNKKIRDVAGRSNFWKDYKRISLNTSNGVVTLEGIIDNKYDQQNIMSEIQRIIGVRSVQSNLKIKFEQTSTFK